MTTTKKLLLNMDDVKEELERICEEKNITN